MVRPLTWVLVGLLLYTLVVMGLRARGMLPDAIRVSGPITTLHTKRGRAFLTHLARPRRFWRAYANVGVGIGLVVMVVSFVFVILSGVASLETEPTVLNQPRNALVIPGVNQFIPLSVTPYVVVGLVVGLIVHEGGHGLLCRVEDIDIESMGLALLTVVPIGAFVEPDEESRAAADRGAQIRMFAAGVTNNFVVGALCILLLFGPVAGSIAVVDGYTVGGTLGDGPADRAGIAPGDVITSVNGTAVDDPASLGEVLGNVETEHVAIGLRDREDVTVQRRLVVRGAPQDSPIRYNSTVTAVNGTAVYTVAGFREAISDRPVARLTTSRGEATLPMGALVRVTEGGPLDDAGAPAGESVVVTAVDGQRILTTSDLRRAIDSAAAGATVDVVAYDDGPTTHSVTFADADGAAEALGAQLGQPGTTGLTFTELGVQAYPAGYFLEAMGGDADRPTGLPDDLPVRLFVFLFLPFLGIVPELGTGFAGFVGVAENFYVAQGPLAFLGTGGVFALANVLYWTSWVNVIVGQFNLIPTYPLDGGHILRAGTESVVSRLPVERKRALTRVVTVSVGLSMLGGLLLVLFGPRLPI